MRCVRYASSHSKNTSNRSSNKGSRSSRNRLARAGDTPLVLIAIRSGPRCTRAGSVNVEYSGWSVEQSRKPFCLVSSYRSRLRTSSVRTVLSTSQISPSTSEALKRRPRCRIFADAARTLSSSDSLGLTTVTLAPASRSRLLFSVASSPPPTTTHGRSFTSRLIWKPNFMAGASYPDGRTQVNTLFPWEASAIILPQRHRRSREQEAARTVALPGDHPAGRHCSLAGCPPWRQGSRQFDRRGRHDRPGVGLPGGPHRRALRDRQEAKRAAAPPRRCPDRPPEIPPALRGDQCRREAAGLRAQRRGGRHRPAGQGRQRRSGTTRRHRGRVCQEPDHGGRQKRRDRPEHGQVTKKGGDAVRCPPLRTEHKTVTARGCPNPAPRSSRGSPASSPACSGPRS